MMVLQMMAAVCIQGGHTIILEALGYAAACKDRVAGSAELTQDCPRFTRYIGYCSVLATDGDGGGFRFHRLIQILRTAETIQSSSHRVELQVGRCDLPLNSYTVRGSYYCPCELI